MYFQRKRSVDKFNDYEGLGKSLFADVVNQADDSLLGYISEDGILKGDVIQNAWFPKLKGKFDVFISHSHNDEDLAFAFAGWLNKKFKLRCFLDKYVWNSADGLIKKLDDLCRRPGGKGYNYRDRNMTTSQIHAMLTSAIMQEIDDCDALFFLNTPNTIDVVTETQEYTLSPWIFLEIGFSKLLNKEWKNEKRIEIVKNSIANEAATRRITNEAVVQMRMKLDTSHLTELNENELQDWLDVWKGMRNTEGYNALNDRIEKIDQYDPLIVLDSQHGLPSKGPDALYD